jgi:hypothetical protein
MTERRCPVARLHPDPSQYAETCCRYCQIEMHPDVPLRKLPPPCSKPTKKGRKTTSSKRHPPCVFRGKEKIDTDDIVESVNEESAWVYCSHPKKEYGKLVTIQKEDEEAGYEARITCWCIGCGPKCNGYQLPENDQKQATN